MTIIVLYCCLVWSMFCWFAFFGALTTEKVVGKYNGKRVRNKINEGNYVPQFDVVSLVQLMLSLKSARYKNVACVGVNRCIACVCVHFRLTTL